MSSDSSPVNPSRNSVQWNDSILNSTYHDVEIKQVQIVEGRNNVKFDEQKLTDQQSETSGRQSGGIRIIAPPPSEDDFQNGKKNDNWQDYQRRPSTVSFIIGAEKRIKDEQNQSKVPVINVPIAPVGLVVPKTAPTSKSRQFDRNIREKRRQKLNQQRRVTSKMKSPMDRRLLSGNERKRTQLYEVSPGVFVPELPPDIPQTAPENGFYSNEIYYQDIKAPAYVTVERATTVPLHLTKSVIWTSKNRYGSSRALSSLSSAKWKLQQEAMSDPMKRVNMFVKMPFKQSPYMTMQNDGEMQGDDVVQANDDLRVATAFTVSRIRRAMNNMEAPSNAQKSNGRLLKGKLKPLRPVKDDFDQEKPRFAALVRAMSDSILKKAAKFSLLYSVQVLNNGPTVNDCRGIQPENRKVRSYSPSPSRQRQLKEDLNVAMMNHRAKAEEELERRMQVQSTASRESIHRTSPQPPYNDEMNQEMIFVNEETNLYDKISESSYENKMSNHLGSMTLESAVIY